MTRFCIFLTVILGLSASALLATDIDQDGIDDTLDVCTNTPAGVPVHETGRPMGDQDGDCDVDLADVALVWEGFTGPMCPPGYFNDGVGCSDVNESVEFNEVCGQNSDCTNESGNYSCSCRTGFANCDDLTGCEVELASSPNDCETATFLGVFCGDTLGRTDTIPPCAQNPWALAAMPTGRTSAWFRSTAIECSSCTASLTQRFTLQVPDGADYDLYLYTDCGTLHSSKTGTAATHQLLAGTADTAANDEQDFWIEVRYISGASCAPWSLTVEGREPYK